MAYRYWSMMTDKKFALIYLGLHYHKNVQIERWMNIILAIISTGSLGALLFFDQHQYILTIILALAQIATAARPYLPYQYRMQEIEKGLFVLNDLYNDIEEKWLSIASGTLSDEEINDLYYEFVRKWDELDSKILKKDSLPRRKKYIKQGKGQNAKEELVDFFDGKPLEELSLNEHDQRMILVAGQFRKEVTSTAMWMLNHGISVQCFKATPYQYGDELLLDIEQIIPVKEAEEYLIKMADKTKEAQSVKEANKGIDELRRKYWTALLEKFNTISKQFQNVNPSTDHWLSGGSGVSGIPFSFVATKNYASVEININKGDRETNKAIYDRLEAQKEEIEKDFGAGLVWQRLEEKKSCRIASRLEAVNVQDYDDWDKIIDFHCKAMPKFYKALHDRLLAAVKGL